MDRLPLKKMLITVSKCAVDSPHAFQDGSPNPLEPFKVNDKTFPKSRSTTYILKIRNKAWII